MLSAFLLACACLVVFWLIAQFGEALLDRLDHLRFSKPAPRVRPERAEPIDLRAEALRVYGVRRGPSIAGPDERERIL